jgi:YggT family protein
MLIVLHAVITVILLNIRSDIVSSMAGSATLLKIAVIHSLELIVNLTGFFMIVIIINALMSWVSPDPTNPLVQLITLISAPIIDPLRRVIPPVGGMIDISPIIAIIALQVLNVIGHGILAQL